LKIISIRLKNFRNYENAIFNFDKSSTLIIGPNASGKTNILESIHILSVGKSQRAKRELDLIRNGCQTSYIGALIDYENDGGNKLDVAISKGQSLGRTKKNYRVNNVTRVQSQFLGKFHSVYFSPSDIRLVLGSPARRRSAIDEVLSQVYTSYKINLLIYQKSLKQKNKLLEAIWQRKAIYHQVDYWNKKLLETGFYIQKKRAEFFIFCNDKLLKLGEVLNKSNKSLRLRYKKNVITKERIDRYKDIEVRRGLSLIGPHRDDFEFIKERNKDLGSFGSRGEQRTAVFALKVCELLFLQEKTKEVPVLLLDDIFSELDEAHRKNILKVIKGRQAIITTAEGGLVPKNLLSKSKIIGLK